MAFPAESRWGVILLFVLGVVVASSAQPSVQITVDASRTFQTMDGFGSSERVFDDPHLTDTFDPKTERGAVVLTRAQQDEVLDRLYVDLQFTRVRPALDGGIEIANDNRDPNVTDLSKFNFAWKRTDAHVDYVKRAMARGVTSYFLSPLRLESWMGRNSATDVAEYVEWAMAQLRRWRQLDVEVPFYSVFNEPGLNDSMSGEFIRDVIKAMGPRLEREAFATRFVITDDWGPQQAYERCVVILSDPTARRYVAALASHLYTSLDLGQMSALARQHRLPLWMTEYSRSEANRDAFQYASLISDLITRYDVSAVDYMWGFFGAWDDAQLIRLKYNDPRFADYDADAGPEYRGYDLDKAYYTIGQFSRYVGPGSQRIAAASEDPSLSVSAFRSGADVIVVVVNDRHVDRTMNLSLKGIARVTGVRMTRTTETENWADLSRPLKPSTVFATSIPRRSVTTFVVTGVSSAI